MPVRLANGPVDRYDNGHKLHTLLWEHSQAMCTDPRDNFYGFIGLAIDCDSRFQIDYDRGHSKICKDAVMYENRNLIAQKPKIVEFAYLVSNLPEGPEIIINKEDLSPDWKHSGHR